MLRGSSGVDAKKQMGDTAEAGTNAKALAALLDATGVDAATLAAALESIAIATAATAPAPEQENSIYQKRELIYDDEDAFVFVRGDTKRKNYYLRMWDGITKKPYVKSLGTPDRIKAIAAARKIYADVSGKIERGERVRQITTAELVKEYLHRQEQKITNIPRNGITPNRYRFKVYCLNLWLEYITELGYEKTPIDVIAPYKTRDFALWFMQRPKQNKNDKSPRNREIVNNYCSEVLKCYRDVAVKERYISSDQMPDIDRLEVRTEEGHARDTLSLEQYEKLHKFIRNKYCKDKSVSAVERAKRVIFDKTIGILFNTGMRPKELLGLRVNEVYANPNDTPENQQVNVIIKVRASNSKTGRSRVIAAPVARRIEAIKQKQKELGVELQATDYLLINPSSKERKPYTREQLGNRLRSVLELSGLKAELDAEGKKINLYSARHTWITWRLRYGDVPMHLLARAAGTSVSLIDKVYSHISVEKQAAVLTRAQGYAKMAEIDLTGNLYNSGDD